MASPLNESGDDARVEQLVDFDEALRLGRTPALTAPVDPELLQTQQFLLRLQSIWPRTPKKIGPYTLVRGLGQGTVGPAYLVEDPATLQPMVLKVLWPDLSDDPPTRQQFVQDAKAIQQLHHAGIVAVREIRDGGRLCCVVSDFCPGLSLAQWRRQKPQPIAWEIAAGLILQLAEILDVGHRQGLSHGNLKPSNVILDSAQEITTGNLHQASLRVLDFALARAVQQTKLASPGSLAWPMPQYLAPEQLLYRTQPSEPAADVYALGVLWYELLTGRCPVKGTTRDEVLAYLRDAAPPPPRQYRPEIPGAVETLVLRCLHRKQRKRPASAQHLGAALKVLLPGTVAKDMQPAWWKKWLGWV